MSKKNQNREKATAGAEAPHRSVQSANRDRIYTPEQAALIEGGLPAYQRKTAALLRTVCRMFNGQIVEVSL